MAYRVAARVPLNVSLVAAALIAANLAGASFPVRAGETPLSWTASDARLKWGGCPPFMPKGCEIAVLHGDPAKANVDILFRVPENTEIPRHWHTSAERMVLVSGEMSVTYDGHPPALLKAGTYAYGPARHPHRASCGKAGPCVLFIAFESPLDAVPGDAAAKK